MPRFKETDFGHIHVHTDKSRLDGLASVNKAVMRARQLGQRFMACTDHGTIGSWIKFSVECTRKKDKKGKEIPYAPIKPLLGEEFYLSRNKAIHDISGQPEGRKGNRHLIVIAQNWKGYQNLCRLSEESWCKGFYHSPRTDIESLAAHSEGLIVSSACLSSVINASLSHDRYDVAKKAAGVFKDIFPGRFFLEVMFHGIDLEGAIIPDILKLGQELNLPVCCSNDSHYVTKDQARSHEARTCISMSKCILDPKHIRFPYDEYYVKSAQEMGLLFGHRPELLYNTVALADMVDAEDISKHMGGMRLPVFELPAPFTTPQEYLEHLAWEGMKRLNWEHSADHIAALKMELGDVQVAKDNNDYDFATYFLIVWDLINDARKKKIYTGSGRGSGYASILLRCLGITYGPDPLKYNLLWQRFLGFDNKRFYLASDFGLEEIVDLAAIADAVEEEEEELEEPAEFAEDAGGISRY